MDAVEMDDVGPISAQKRDFDSEGHFIQIVPRGIRSGDKLGSIDRLRFA
jgi:hypothetical protein